MHKHEVEGDRNVVLAVVVNLVLTVAQIIGGVVSGSLALIADAIHNLSDAMALVIAFGARQIARLPANAGMSFGYGRAELVAALINYTTLIVIGLFLIYEAILRFIDPQGINGWIVVVLAALALVIDLITVGLTHRLAKNSMNIRAAFLHNVADALGSIGVIVAGTIIILYDWRYIDPLITLGIAAYILWQALTEGISVVRVLMLATPLDMDRDRVADTVMEVPGVKGVHHVHVWQIDEHRRSFEAHIVVANADVESWEYIKSEIRKVLSATHHVDHATLELEFDAEGGCTQ